jgi:hypothetical protein
VIFRPAQPAVERLATAGGGEGVGGLTGVFIHYVRRLEDVARAREAEC